jgi:iron donor protein CyaY
VPSLYTHPLSVNSPHICLHALLMPIWCNSRSNVTQEPAHEIILPFAAFPCPEPEVCWLIYNATMLDDNDFRKQADDALGSLKQSLITAEESADIEVEDQAGALHVSFDDGSRFVISPNAPVRQIWISALSTSFKLDWSDANQDFVLQKTGEGLKPLVARLINQQLGEEAVTM